MHKFCNLNNSITEVLSADPL